MTRFTEILLFVAYTPLLLSFANGLHAMQSTVKHDALRKNGVIRGLLETRQTYYYCLTGEYTCQVSHCCTIGYSCCSDGNCCIPQTYCHLASNGIIGCCPNGGICTGPAGDPTTIRPPSPTYTSIFLTYSSIAFTSTSLSTSIPTSTSTSTSTTTYTTLLGGPTQGVGESIVEVTALDPNIQWSGHWVQGISSCSPSVTSKSTSTGGSSCTHIFNYSAVQTYGVYYYFNVGNSNAKWEVIIDGVTDQTYDSYTSINCTYLQSSFQPVGTGTSQNITLVVHGSDTLGSTTSDAWSFQFNKLLILEQNVSSPTSTTLGGLGTPTTTSSPALNASGRAQPYRPLLVFAGILLALLYCA